MEKESRPSLQLLCGEGIPTQAQREGTPWLQGDGGVGRKRAFLN